MEIDRKRYIYHLDDIRQKKNMTVAELCDGVCSERQYRKYLSGTNNISDARITEFCDVLGISTRDFYYSINTADIYEYKKVENIYNLILEKKYEEANEKMSEFKDRDQMTTQNAKYLAYCEARYRFELKIDYVDETHKTLSELINYPACSNNTVFDIVDVISLITISKIETKAGKDDAMNVLIHILTTDGLLYLSADTRQVIPTIYSSVGLSLGRMKRYEECLKVSKEGLEYCNLYNFSKSKTWLYYFVALASKHLGLTSEVEKNAVYCMCNVISTQRERDIKTFYNLLLKDFNKDPFQMILENKHNVLPE